MVRQFITLNTGGNNYTLRFPKTVSLDKDTKLSLFSFSMYNSFYNIFNTCTYLLYLCI